MDTYKFYYDESEHSRKINYNTVTAPNYYDNFVTVVVGWSKENEKEVFKKYEDFENKYADRKDRNGELKSTTLKQKKLECGFASLDKANTQFIMDFLSIFDESTKLYFSVASKIEYLVLQLFIGYQNNFIIDADAVKYSITKALVAYRPQNVIQSIYDDNSKEFVEELKRFFRERIECNRSNMSLKEQENEAFENILYILDDISAIPELQWDYHMPFSGFLKYLQEEQIKDIVKLILKELSDRLQKQLDITLTASDEAVAYLAGAGFDPAFGARPLKRLIVHTVENILGKKIVAGEIGSGTKVKVVLKDGKIEVEQE